VAIVAFGIPDAMSGDASAESDARWLAAFHAGERWALEECYRAHAARVTAAAGAVLGRVDAETITHEVFYRLLSNAKMRESFRGGNLGAWLSQVVTHSAIDDLRRRRRELATAEPPALATADTALALELDAKRIVGRFRTERLPPEWDPVFEARFLRQLSQRDAAQELGIPRSTLVYQEQRIRALLEDFVLGESAGGDVP
jgi:RNA polymerase sigma-70 factor (ECF subfamily)